MRNPFGGRCCSMTRSRPHPPFWGEGISCSTLGRIRPDDRPPIAYYQPHRSLSPFLSPRTEKEKKGRNKRARLGPQSRQAGSSLTVSLSIFYSRLRSSRLGGGGGQKVVRPSRKRNLASGTSPNEERGRGRRSERASERPRGSADGVVIGKGWLFASTPHLTAPSRWPPAVLFAATTKTPSGAY